MRSRTSQTGWPAGSWPVGQARGRSEARDRVEELAGVGRLGRGEERPDRRLLDLPAAAHDEHPRRHLGDDAHVVGDQDHRDAGPPLEVAQEGEDLRLNRDVEGGGRFVGDQQLRPAGERHGDHHPLPLPAGKLVRILAEPAGGLRDADLGEKLDRSGARVARSGRGS